MMALRGLIGLLAGALLLVGCGKSETLRYRLTAEVETPAGVRRGSSVLETSWAGASPVAKAILGTQGGGSQSFRGEAVAVDLPGGQTLFVLLRSANDLEWPANVTQEIGHGAVTPVPRLKNGVSNYPLFVRFRNLADPKSVEELDPDNLAKTFGPGYQLKALTFQRTVEPVTTGIEKRLAWLHQHAGSLVPYPSQTPISEIPEAHRLTSRSFEQGDIG